MSHNVVTGVSVAFESLVSGFERQRLPYAVVDLKRGATGSRVGAFDFRRVLGTLRILVSVWANILCVDCVYIIIASSSFGFLRDALMIWPSRLFHRRIVLHLHGGGYQGFYGQQSAWHQWVIRTTLAKADAIVILGNLLRNQFEFVPEGDKKLRIVPNGLPADLQAEESTFKSLPKDGPLHLLYLSNMIESKGYLDVLAACRILHSERKLPIRCDFCGDFLSVSVDDSKVTAQSAKANFLALVLAWKLDDVVTYRGVVTGQVKQKLLQQAHVFLLPTVYPWEGQPISIIEAMAFGTPIVATAHRAIPEEVIHGYNGFLVEGHSPEQIANAVHKLVTCPGLYAEMSRNALDHFRAHFTQEQYVSRLISVIFE